MKRRAWIPDAKLITDQLINDYQTGTWAMESGQMGFSQGDNDSLGTIASWQATGRDHAEEFTENDWVALVQELARRAAAAGSPNDLGLVPDRFAGRPEQLGQFGAQSERAQGALP